MAKIKNFINDNKEILVILTGSIICIFLYLFLFDRPFAFNNDQLLQYKYFYEEWINLLENFLNTHKLPMYSWNSFLGSDFYSSQTYYVVGDFFVVLYPLFNDIDTFLFVEMILCIYISGITMNIFLTEFGIKTKWVRILVSVSYALSGFATLFYGQYMFHRFYAFMPLLFCGIERIINNKGSWLFVFSIALLFTQNYYLMFPVSILLPIYCVFTFQKKNILNIKNVFKYGTYFIVMYLFGFLISSFITFPAINYIISNERLGTNTISSFEPQVYLGLILNWGHHFLERSEYKSIFLSGESGHMSFYSLYYGVLLFLGMFSLIFKKGYRKLFLLMIPFALLCVPSLNSIVHGFSEPTLRWSFIIVFFACILSSIYFDEIDDNKSLKKALNYYSLIYVVTLVVGYFTGLVDIKEHNFHLLALVIYFVLMHITIHLYIRDKRYGIAITIASLILSSTFIIYHLNKKYYNFKDDLDIKVLDYIKDIDDDMMFRYYMNNDIMLPTSTINLNQSLHYGVMGTKTYNTMYEPNLKPFLEDIDINWHIIDIRNPEILKLLGVKYYIAYSEKDLPEGNVYEFVQPMNHLNLYVDTEYKNIGFTYNSFISKEDLDLDNHNWLETLIVENDFDYSGFSSETKSIGFDVKEVETNILRGEIELTEDSVLFFSIPFNQGWTCFVDGEISEIIKVNDGFIGIPLNEGYHNITLSFVTPFLKEGLLASAASFVLYIAVLIFNRIRNK